MTSDDTQPTVAPGATQPTAAFEAATQPMAAYGATTLPTCAITEPSVGAGKSTGPSPQRPCKGMSLGRYTLEARLGKGGMGSVWLANHPMLNVKLAIKVLDPQVANAKHTHVARFLQEAKLAATIHHPNLVCVNDVDRDPASGLYYLVMEHVPGGTLTDLLARRGTLDEAEALRIVRQIAEALRHAVQYGMVHRDIKPDNIMFGENGEAKLADLGIAKAPCANEEQRLTLATEAFGTPAYMSPEQAYASANVDIRADIYSLGLVLYEMLSGRRGYCGKTTAEIIQQVVSDRLPPDLHAIRPEISPATVALVREMIAKRPEVRPANPDILLQRIDAALAALPKGRTRGRRLCILAGAFVGGLLLVAVLLFLPTRQKPPATPPPAAPAPSPAPEAEKPAVAPVEPEPLPIAEMPVPMEVQPVVEPPPKPVEPPPSAPAVKPKPVPLPEPELPKVDPKPAPLLDPEPKPEPDPEVVLPPPPEPKPVTLVFYRGTTAITSAAVRVDIAGQAPIILGRKPYTFLLPEGATFSYTVDAGRQGDIGWGEYQSGEQHYTAQTLVVDDLPWQEPEPPPVALPPEFVPVRGLHVRLDGADLNPISGTLFWNGGKRDFTDLSPEALATLLRQNIPQDCLYTIRFNLPQRASILIQVAEPNRFDNLIFDLNQRTIHTQEPKHSR
ncbi:MAG: serine/threonine-protein kinase [Candidatus Spyradenecus sp.]